MMELLEKIPRKLSSKHLLFQLNRFDTLCSVAMLFQRSITTACPSPCDGGSYGLLGNRTVSSKFDRFSDTCNFLISTSKEKHIWCSYRDAISPLLETFCNYYKEEVGGSPLKVLWKRMCYEIRGCT
ncbi:hypothetical protein Droror1_Dr00004700 [Drosera rotundifolia]